MSTHAALTNAIDDLYRAFARYEPPLRVSPCTLCWDAPEMDALRSTPLREIGAELSRRLLWETGDHWESTEAFKHYLPRILEALSPEIGVEDLYPEHIFETLLSHGFWSWPGNEQAAVLGFVSALGSLPGDKSESMQDEWRRAAATLLNRAPRQR